MLGLGMGRLWGRRKDTGFPLTTGGNDRGETGGKDRRVWVGRGGCPRRTLLSFPRSLSPTFVIGERESRGMAGSWVPAMLGLGMGRLWGRRKDTGFPLTTGGNDRGETGGKDRRVWVGRGGCPRRTLLSFPRKRESRGMGGERETGRTRSGREAPHRPTSLGRRKDTGFPLTTCGNDRRGLAGMTGGGQRE